MAGNTGKGSGRSGKGKGRRRPPPPGRIDVARDWAVNFVLFALIRSAGLIPYRKRLSLFSLLTRRVFGPVAGWNRRADTNLRFIYPDMDAATRRAITESALDNLGRAFMENYYAADFRRVLAGTPLSGPGADAVMDALENKRPVILVASHYGNYEAPRTTLAMQGHPIGIIYRKASNAHFQRHYHAVLDNGAGPAFIAGDKTGPKFTDLLRAGGALVLAHDLYFKQGTILPFLGREAPTAMSAAGLALRFGALMVPYYGIRAADGVGFTLWFDDPVPHSDEETMSLDLNKSLEAQIALDPGQWLWPHRRWKNITGK